MTVGCGAGCGVGCSGCVGCTDCVGCVGCADSVDCAAGFPVDRASASAVVSEAADSVVAVFEGKASVDTASVDGAGAVGVDGVVPVGVDGAGTVDIDGAAPACVRVRACVCADDGRARAVP